jgi:hypothetical protein
MPDTVPREDVVVDPETPPETPPEETPPTPPEDDLPEEFKGMTPAQIAAQAKEEKGRREQAEAHARQTNESYVQAIMGGAVQPPPQAPEEPALPDPEEEPEKYRDAVVDKKIRDAIAQAATPVMQGTQQAMGVALQTAIEQQKYRMQSNPDKFPGYTELEKEIEEYLGNFPIEQQAAPNAREEIYYRMMGKKQAKETAEASRRPAIEPGGRSSASRESTEEAEPVKLEVQEERANRERLPAGMFKDMQGPGVMDIDEYLATKAKHKYDPKRRA